VSPPRARLRAVVYPEDEESWLAWVIDYATRAARPAWRHYHTRRSTGSVAGFPDLTLWRERVVFAELKTERGRVTRDQWAVLDGLRAAGAEVYVWRPSDRPEIERILR
jgi:VRR-NUC domain